ncbi:MAG TPA: Gfo/Idh/MocA family oxidoreductase [Chloroflexi bacterium]|jgi:predicted dehydrogenase|nr:Gfo/Idh/MocA family oxidoreductase [Chloroflexota bacterium]
MPFNYEYEKKLRVGFIGAGEHAYRNILPSFQYAPIELVAIADHDSERGLAVARQFGAQRFYPNHKALLAKEELDAVFIVVGPDAEGRPRYPELAGESLRAGFHTWIDKPPCASASEIQRFTEACMARHKYVATGFKKMFAPAYLKVAEIIADPSFGGVSSFSLRYPLSLPPEDQRNDSRAMAPFLEIVHPLSLLTRLFGESQGLVYLRSKSTGGLVVSLRYRKGFVGTLHLTGGQAPTGTLERLEVIGDGAHVVVENGTRLTYYRPGGTRGQGEPGRDETFFGADDTAPIIWEPEFSLGQLYNKQLFLQGYVGCVRHFAERLLAGEPPKHGNLVDMLHIMTVHDRIVQGKENTWIAS